MQQRRDINMEFSLYDCALAFECSKSKGKMYCQDVDDKCAGCACAPQYDNLPYYRDVVEIEYDQLAIQGMSTAYPCAAKMANKIAKSEKLIKVVNSIKSLEGKSNQNKIDDNDDKNYDEGDVDRGDGTLITRIHCDQYPCI